MRIGTSAFDFITGNRGLNQAIGRAHPVRIETCQPAEFFQNNIRDNPVKTRGEGNGNPLLVQPGKCIQTTFGGGCALGTVVMLQNLPKGIVRHIDPGLNVGALFAQLLFPEGFKYVSFG